jgi:hypothetical protein
MNHIIPALFILLFWGTAKSQQYVPLPDTAKWRIREINPTSQNTQVVTDATITLNGETDTINGLVYKKALFRYHKTVVNNTIPPILTSVSE